MLISEIEKDHENNMAKLEKKFQDKIAEQAANEKSLKQTLEAIQKYNE